LRAGFGERGISFLQSNWGYVAQALELIAAACVCGWLCGALLEGLPVRAPGWTRHRGWLRDLLVGSLVGAVSLLLATIIATACGGFHFQWALAGMTASVLKTLLVSGGFFRFGRCRRRIHISRLSFADCASFMACVVSARSLRWCSRECI
jgi:hypothetical protein